MNKEQLTIKEAYFSMLDYFEELYERTNSKELGIMLSEMHIDIGSGNTMDPAAWWTWLRTVKKVKPQIEIPEEMYVCCEFKYSDFSEEETRNILKQVTSDKENYVSKDERDGSICYAKVLANGKKAWKIIQYGRPALVGNGDIPKFYLLQQKKEHENLSQ